MKRVFIKTLAQYESGLAHLSSEQKGRRQMRRNKRSHVLFFTSYDQRLIKKSRIGAGRGALFDTHDRQQMKSLAFEPGETVLFDSHDQELTKTFIFS